MYGFKKQWNLAEMSAAASDTKTCNIVTSDFLFFLSPTIFAAALALAGVTLPYVQCVIADLQPDLCCAQMLFLPNVSSHGTATVTWGSAVVKPRACFLQMSDSILVFIVAIHGNVISHGCPVKILEEEEANIIKWKQVAVIFFGNVCFSRAGKSLCIYALGPVAQVWKASAAFLSYLSLISQSASASASQRGSAVLLNSHWAAAGFRSSGETTSWRLQHRGRPEKCEQKFKIEAQWTPSSTSGIEQCGQSRSPWPARWWVKLVWELRIMCGMSLWTQYFTMFSESTTTKTHHHTDNSLVYWAGWLKICCDNGPTQPPCIPPIEPKVPHQIGSRELKQRWRNVQQ